MSKVPLIKREDFIKQLVKQEGFTHMQAAAAFACFIRTIDNGVCNGAKIYLSEVGVLNPVIAPARPVTMGFEKKAGGEVDTSEKRVFWLGRRIRYKFRVFPAFLRKRQLDWQL